LTSTDSGMNVTYKKLTRKQMVLVPNTVKYPYFPATENNGALRKIPTTTPKNMLASRMPILQQKKHSVPQTDTGMTALHSPPVSHATCSNILVV